MADSGYGDPIEAVKLMKGAKTKHVYFAFVPGGTPGESVLGVDKTHAGDHILAALKKQTGATKGAFGTVQLDGANAVFTVEHDVTGFEKALIAWFHFHHVTSPKPTVAA